MLYGLDPLGRVGDLEGGAVMFIVFVDKIDLHHRLVQVVAFDAVVRINTCDFFSDNGQFQPDGAAAVEKTVLQD